MNILVMITTALFAFSAHSGTISGGGGKIQRYESNPWFLENTKVIRYCIAVDQNFGVSKRTIHRIVRLAINEWKDAFDFTEDSVYESGSLEPYGQIRVATQRFQRNCEMPDLNFQFGFLTKEQLEYFSDPREYVGAAVRTTYDLKTLKSKGFVYIAPLEGELAPDVQDIDKQAWQKFNHKLLKLTLSHELGHIFGIGHNSNGWPNMNVMTSLLPATIIDKHFTKMYADGNSWAVKDRSPMTLFKTRTTDVYSSCNDIFWGWHSSYRLPGNYKKPQCTKIEFFEDYVVMSESEDHGSSWHEIGKLKSNNWSRSFQSYVKVYLPKAQQVFTKLPESNLFFPLQGEVGINGESYTGVYKASKSNDKIGLRLDISPGNQLNSTAAFPNLKVHSDIITVN